MCKSSARLTGLRAMLVFAALLLSSGTPALAQWAQQWLPLSAGQPGGGGAALSADGNTALVGDIGGPWVFTRFFNSVFGYMYQQGPQLLGTGNTGTGNAGNPFDVSPGYSMALSADGNTAIVGAPADSGSTGAAWLFTRSGATWTQAQKLVGSGAGPGAGQGLSVALSADGSTAIVGGPGDNNGAGAAWAFTRTYNVYFGYIYVQQKLVGSGAIGPGAHQGFSVALSADGSTAIVGGDLDNWGQGAAWVFTRSGFTWTEQQKLVGSKGSVGAQGFSVALSADGNTAIVGGCENAGGQGAAWVFTRSGFTWTEQQKLIGSGAIGRASQGTSVALSADGNTAMVGGPVDGNLMAAPSDPHTNRGAAWVFTRSGGTWTQQQKLVGSLGSDWAGLGLSVALSADGNTAMVGAVEWFQAGIEKAWVFVQKPTVTGVNSNGLVHGISGEHVIIKGTGFTGATAVTFGGVPAGNLVVVDPDTIKVTTPPHAPGTVDVAVTNSIGTGIGHGLYTYLQIVPVLP